MKRDVVTVEEAPASGLTRRSFGAANLQALLLACLFQQSARADALEGTLKWSLRPWLSRLDEVSVALSDRVFMFNIGGPPGATRALR